MGNVISALGTGQKTVSFRESKLTRLLQGSLGGNSITLMIACVSPADYNLDETLSTLRYADRAKQIKNKPVINRDPISEEIARLNDIILRLRNQLAAVGRSGDVNAEASTLNGTLMLGRGGGAGGNALADATLKATNAMLVNEVALLQLQMHSLDTMRDGCVEAVDRLNGQVKELEGMLMTGNGEDTEKRSSEDILSAMTELKVTISALKLLLNIESDETVWHDAPSRESLEGSEAGQTFLISSQTFTADMKRLKDELTMKEHLARKLMDNLVPEEESQATIAALATKIAELEQEKVELSSAQRPKQKTDVAARLAEERRRKIALLEKEIDGMRRKIQKHEKLITLHKNTQKSLNSLQGEIKELKQQKVQLVKNLRKDQDKFRQLQLKSDKEMNVMREKEKKRFHEMKKLEAQHERQKAYLQRRVEEANIKARRAENLLNKQRRTKRVSVLKEPAQIEKRLHQELEIIYFVSEVKASLTVLMEARTELTNQLKHLKGTKVPEEAARVALLQAEIEERTHTINDLQQKIQAYDLTAKVELMAQEVQPNEALKILLDQVSDMQEEHFGDKLKWEAAESAFRGRVEELERAAEEHGKELLRTQKGKQEDMALLLDGFLDDEGEEEGQGQGENPKMRQMVKNAMDEAQALREHNEMLKEELAAAQRIMEKKASRPVKKHVQRVMQEEIMDSETDGDMDDEQDNDPNWSFSMEAEAKSKRRAGVSTINKDSSVADTSSGAANNSGAGAANSSVVHCNCKTDCSRWNCSCRKNSLFCSSKCGCKACVNKDQPGSASEGNDSPAVVAAAAGNKVNNDDDEEEDEDEEEERGRNSKRIK